MGGRRRRCFCGAIHRGHCHPNSNVWHVHLCLLQSEASTKTYFEDWKRLNKVRIPPGTADYTYRLSIFQETLQYILSINQQGNKTYVLSPNKFSHLTDDEFAQGYLGVGSSAPDLSASQSEAFDGSPDDIVDWLERGKDTEVKDQESVSTAAINLSSWQWIVQGWDRSQCCS